MGSNFSGCHPTNFENKNTKIQSKISVSDHKRSLGWPNEDPNDDDRFNNGDADHHAEVRGKTMFINPGVLSLTCRPQRDNLFNSIAKEILPIKIKQCERDTERKKEPLIQHLPVYR